MPSVPSWVWRSAPPTVAYGTFVGPELVARRTDGLPAAPAVLLRALATNEALTPVRASWHAVLQGVLLRISTCFGSSCQRSVLMGFDSTFSEQQALDALRQHLSREPDVRQGLHCQVGEEALMCFGSTYQRPVLMGFDSTFQNRRIPMGFDSTLSGGKPDARQRQHYQGTHYRASRTALIGSKRKAVSIRC